MDFDTAINGLFFIWLIIVAVVIVLFVRGRM